MAIIVMLTAFYIHLISLLINKSKQSATLLSKDFFDNFFVHYAAVVSSGAYNKSFFLHQSQNEQFELFVLSNSWSPNSILDSVFGLILWNEYYSFFRKIRFEYRIVAPVSMLYFFLFIGANMQKNCIGTLLFSSKLLDLLSSKL